MLNSLLVTSLQLTTFGGVYVSAYRHSVAPVVSSRGTIALSSQNRSTSVHHAVAKDGNLLLGNVTQVNTTKRGRSRSNARKPSSLLAAMPSDVFHRREQLSSSNKTIPAEDLRNIEYELIQIKGILLGFATIGLIGLCCVLRDCFLRDDDGHEPNEEQSGSVSFREPIAAVTSDDAVLTCKERKDKAKRNDSVRHNDSASSSVQSPQIGILESPEGMPGTSWPPTTEASSSHRSIKNVTAIGKQARGGGVSDKYKFGDFTRGLVMTTPMHATES